MQPVRLMAIERIHPILCTIRGGLGKVAFGCVEPYRPKRNSRLRDKLLFDGPERD